MYDEVTEKIVKARHMQSVVVYIMANYVHYVRTYLISSVFSFLAHLALYCINVWNLTPFNSSFWTKHLPISYSLISFINFKSNYITLNSVFLLCLKVCYEAGTRGSKLPPLYMNALENHLIPTLHSISSGIEESIILELIFYILNV